MRVRVRRVSIKPSAGAGWLGRTGGIVNIITRRLEIAADRSAASIHPPWRCFPCIWRVSVMINHIVPQKERSGDLTGSVKILPQLMRQGIGRTIRWAATGTVGIKGRIDFRLISPVTRIQVVRGIIENDSRGALQPNGILHVGEGTACSALRARVQEIVVVDFPMADAII